MTDQLPADGLSVRNHIARQLIDDLHECRQLFPYDNPAIQDSRESQPLAARVHLLRCNSVVMLFGRVSAKPE